MATDYTYIFQDNFDWEYAIPDKPKELSGKDFYVLKIKEKFPDISVCSSIQHLLIFETRNNLNLHLDLLKSGFIYDQVLRQEEGGKLKDITEEVGR